MQAGLSLAIEAHPPLLTVVDEYKKPSPPTSPRIHQAGIDDVTFSLQVADPERREMLRHWSVGTRLGRVSRDGFESLWPPHQAFWFPKTGTLSVQAKRTRKASLLPAGELRDAAQNIVGTLVDAGIVDRGDRPYATGRLRCTRIDSAVDVEFPSALDGSRFLRALSLVHEWGGFYPQVIGVPGEQTVQHRRRRGKNVAARVYSRHREEIGRVPGEIIRLEVQHRMKPSVEARSISPAHVRDWWVEHFVSMAPTNGKVKIAQTEAIVVALAERVAADEITARQAADVAFFLQVEQLGMLDAVFPSRKIKDRRRLVKQLGVKLSDAQSQDLNVDVGQVVALGVDRQHWR